jgi:ATP-dependent exoDNAse (exonuclease V) beta subunit
MRSARSALQSIVEQVAIESSASLELVPEAVALAQSVHDAFVGGAAFAHFRSVAAHVVARELPIMEHAEQADGLSTLSNGAIDLVYRDPSTNDLVVVDYKTGAVADVPQKHREQIGIYRRALQRALSLERLPRGELWYLAASRVETVG